MIDNTEVGRRIGAYLKLTGRKNTWFGERMGWNHDKTSTVLNGKRQLGLVEFFKACDVLEVSPEQFITRDDIREKA